jgi:NTE family protein
MDGYGLVLGGGGAKGSYEVGVWKALRELDIPICAVAGTSVGALNAAMIVQGDFETTYKYWTELSTESVISSNKNQDENKKKYIEFLDMAKEFVVSKGLDITPLKEMLLDLVDEDKVRESALELGMVTFSLTDLKPLSVFKEDIPEGKLVDYLIASASFPAFKPQEIDDKLYIDGGFSDTLPISLMIEKGIKKIIAVDIEGPGIYKKYDDTGIEMIYIKPGDGLGAVLDFDGEKARKNIQMGYLDTLKKFKKLKGVRYYIKSNDDIEKVKDNLIGALSVSDFKSMYAYLGIDWASKPTAAKKLVLEIILRTLKTYTDGKLSTSSVILAMAEIAAERLGVDSMRAYTLTELIDETMKSYEDVCESQEFKGISWELGSLIRSLNPFGRDKEFKLDSIEEKFLVSYRAEIDENDEKVKKFRRLVAVTIPKVCIANIFLALVSSRCERQQI